MLGALLKWFKGKSAEPVVRELKKAYCIGCREHTLIADFIFREVKIPPRGVRNQIKGTCTRCNNHVTTFV
tara:strand:+ start:278 stop:487 length:210 start_codon:yes stop_codon:yes gene_type:complete